MISTLRIVGLALACLVTSPALAQDTVPTFDELLAYDVALKPELVGVHPRVFVTRRSQNSVAFAIAEVSLA